MSPRVDRPSEPQQNFVEWFAADLWALVRSGAPGRRDLVTYGGSLVVVTWDPHAELLVATTDPAIGVGDAATAIPYAGPPVWGRPLRASADLPRAGRGLASASELAKEGWVTDKQPYVATWKVDRWSVEADVLEMTGLVGMTLLNVYRAQPAPGSVAVFASTAMTGA